MVRKTICLSSSDNIKFSGFRNFFQRPAAFEVFRLVGVNIAGRRTASLSNQIILRRVDGDTV